MNGDSATMEEMANELQAKAAADSKALDKKELEETLAVLDGKAGDVPETTLEQRIAVFSAKDNMLTTLIQNYRANYEVYRSLDDKDTVREIVLATRKALDERVIVQREIEKLRSLEKGKDDAR